MPNPFDMLLEPGESRDESTWRWATVTATDPLRIRLDQDPDPLDLDPVNLAGHLMEGTRVWVQLHRSKGMKGALPVIHSAGGSNVGGVFLLDQLDLRGPNSYSAGNVLTVPPSLRGTFQKYVVTVAAGSSGYTGTIARPLCVWINSRLEEEYRNTTILSGGAEIVSAINSTSFPRTGYIHAYNPGALEITFIPNSLGDVGLVSWTTSGWANAGAADGIVITGGGRWNGPTQTITEFRVGTNVSNENWAGASSAQLWGYR